MKIRLYLTAIFVVIYFGIRELINLVYAPLAGTATAQQATNSVTGYALSQFVSNSSFYLGTILLLILVITWLPFLLSKKSNEN